MTQEQEKKRSLEFPVDAREEVQENRHSSYRLARADGVIFSSFCQKGFVVVMATKNDASNPVPMRGFSLWHFDVPFTKH